MHKLTLTTLIALAAFAANARTFNLRVWRGETAAALLPDNIELGAAPEGISVRGGSLKSVKYSPTPNTLELAERYDRVVWGSVSAGPRVVEVIVPADAKPGDYDCGMMRIHVIDRVLPPASQWQYYLDLWQHPWAVARLEDVEPFSKDHYKAMRPIWELLASAGQKTITVSLLEEPWDHQCRDAYHSMFPNGDFKIFDEYVEFCLKCGLGPNISCYSLCPWNLKEKIGSPEFEARWGAFLDRFAAHLKEKGWFKQTIMAMDERAPEDVKSIYNFVQKHAPGMRISMAGNRKPSDFAGITIDIYAQVLWKNCMTPEFLAEAQARRTKGFVTTHYVCCSPTYPNTFMTSGLGEAFWNGVYPAMAGLDGFLRWAWNSWPEDPVKDASFGNWRAGDTFLVYPHAQPSWRFLELRNGIIAAEKLRLLNVKENQPAEWKRLQAFFDVGEANANKINFVKAEQAIREIVNR